MAKKPRNRPTTSHPRNVPFNPAFAGLKTLRDQMAGPETAAAEPAEASESAATTIYDKPEVDMLDLSRSSKLVLQRERKGHGGKTVTRVRGLDLGMEVQSAVTTHLKERLGLGARTDGTDLLVQGAPLHRLQDILTQLGAKQVVLGN